MARKFGQGCIKLEASVDVVGVAPGVDKRSADYAKPHSHVLEGWWVEYRQELGHVSNGGFITKLFHYRQVP